MINSQNQKAGDNSSNFQASQMVVNLGIDEKRAREIYQEMNLQLRNDYSQEALNIANARVTEFENKLMPKMLQVEGALEAFANPSFQLLLVEAQKTAASTERPMDYDLLSELLIYRFQKGENRIARAGISFAVEIVDKISDEALLGLTVSHALSSFKPTSGNIHEGLDVLDNLFGMLFYSELPKGEAWLDHLDLLKAIRLNPLGGKFKTIEKYYSESLSGYVDAGIKKSSESHNKATQILSDANLPGNVLIEHVLNRDFVRLEVTDVDAINRFILKIPMLVGGKPIDFPVELPEEQKKAIKSVYELYSNDLLVKQQNINLFMNEWDKRPNLKKLREWWDSIPNGFAITSAGRVLAHSNAQRCDKRLPPLD